MNFKLQNVLPVLIVISLTACGSPPLIAPEGTETIVQSEPAVQTEPTATLALVGGSADSPLASPTASVEPTESPTPSPTSPGERPSETPRPTETPSPPTQIPQPTQTPPPLATITIVPPGDTATPQLATPVPTMDTPSTIKVIADEPLLSAGVLSKMAIKENASIWVEAWPSVDEIILRVGYYPDPKFWAVSKERGEARQISSWQPEKASQAVVDELQKYNKAVDYAVVSPDGHWAAWAAWETLLVKRLGTEEPPVNLLGKKYERFEGGINELVWSPDSRQIAYAVDNGNASRYEVRISDPLGQQVKIAPLWDTRPKHFAWSPNSQFLAFEMLEQPQSGITQIYLVGQDGKELAQLTQHGLANGPIAWSPAGKSIAYTHGQGDGSKPWLITIEIQ